MMRGDLASPQISVVVPTRDRPAALARCLAALGRTTLDPDQLEIVVVGDGDDVAPPAEGAAGAVPVRWLGGPHRGPAAARNLGARAARAPVVAFTDDDCAPAPGWAERMLRAVEARPDTLVGGWMRNGLPDNPWSSASHHVLEVFVDLYNARPGSPGFAPTSALAMRREVFTAIGGLDESFPTAAAEDRELCDRAAAAGFPIVLERGAVVDHHHELDLRGFLRQSAAYGRGELTYEAVTAEHGRTPDVMTDRFYRELVLRALRRHGLVGGVPMLLRVAASQAAFKVALARARRGDG
jgi:GT2 family glycosyltransferase